VVLTAASPVDFPPSFALEQTAGKLDFYFLCINLFDFCCWHHCCLNIFAFLSPSFSLFLPLWLNDLQVD